MMHRRDFVAISARGLNVLAVGAEDGYNMTITTRSGRPDAPRAS